MVEGDNYDEPDERIERLFALLTAKLEDAAGLAAECQGRRSVGELLAGAREIVALAEEAVTIATAAAALVSADQ